MSFIRFGQDGQYVDIPGGSQYYLYGNGSDIEGWSHEEFAALIGSVVYELDVRTPVQEIVRKQFDQHFGGWDEDYTGDITPPERAEIFCQCVDRRIDGLTLTKELHESAQEWAAEFDAMRDCHYCGEYVRPTIYREGKKYVCDSDECVDKDDARRWGVDVEHIKRGKRIFYHMYYDYGYSSNEASDIETEYLIEKQKSENNG